MKTLLTLIVTFISVSLANAQAPPPTPVTLPPDSITSTSVRLRAQMETNNVTAGHNCGLNFEGGNQMVSLFTSTPWYYFGNSHGTVTVTITATDLVPGMIYHYWAHSAYFDVGVNNASHGENVTFTTLYDSTVSGLLLPLLFEQEGGQTKTRFFGTHTLATECLDGRLGEYEDPPPPPIGAMDVRFRRSCFGQGSTLDARAYRSETQIDTFVLRVQAAYPLRISWPNVNPYYSGTVTLDLGLQTIDMKQVNSVVLDDEPPRVRVITQGPLVSSQYPCIATNAPQDSVQANGRMTGLGNPHGISTTAWFEWGTSTIYGNATTAQSLGSGTGLAEFEDIVNGLSANTLYHFRAVAQNAAGVMYGADQLLRVLDPNDVGEENEIPIEYALKQNYPNPFNPSTVISYDIPVNVYVTLKVYDVLGREVMTLVDGLIEAGYHQATMNASNLASGLYFYRLQAGAYTSVKKLMLMK